MSLEIRTKALEIAASIHKDATSAIAAAESFFTFLTNDAPVKPARGRPVKNTDGTSAEVKPDPTVAAASTVAAPTVAASVTAPAATVEAPVVTVPTLQKVADAIIELANNHSRDKAVAILTKYGVKKVPELKPENFVAVLADVAAAIAPAASSDLV